MASSIQLPPPPNPVNNAAEGDSWFRWFRTLQSAVAKLAQSWAYETLTPTTGFSHQIPNNTGLCLLTPAGGLAAGTVTLPANVLDGFEQTIAASQAVTALTVAPASGQTIVGTTSFTLSAGVRVVFRYTAAAKVWYRLQ